MLKGGFRQQDDVTVPRVEPNPREGTLDGVGRTFQYLGEVGSGAFCVQIAMNPE
ncbi:hypothetical protein M8523_34855 [Hyphomicrobiales bacterium BP6-180914]|uniref:Uncharacterized protein n=1 Tax=Lichenifustis flavocetrariae TaxID=2949735 RepID=A0AA42CS18_9HYPH|nr:hypothetical protein [Lichenifustis flavocetrariae]MCW6513040.1 hypothetical protein [Lichenifustis flavocetrariae]